MPRFVLLDRDGVINQRIVGGYVTCWDKFIFLPGALEGLRLLTEKNYHVTVVSNQAGVGKGLMTAADLQEITRKFVKEVDAQGGRIRSVYYCTHRAEDDCPCRKPSRVCCLRPRPSITLPLKTPSSLATRKAICWRRRQWVAPR